MKLQDVQEKIARLAGINEKIKNIERVLNAHSGYGITTQEVELVSLPAGKAGAAILTLGGGNVSVGVTHDELLQFATIIRKRYLIEKAVLESWFKEKGFET